MTLILAIETSTEWCSVALARHGGEPDQAIVRHEQTGPRSSDRVLPMVDEILGEAGVSLASCSAIAFGAGPGSFTGLRTACGVAQGLAFGADLPVVAVNSLEACVERVLPAVPPGMPVVVALDARMNECYWATFRGAADGGWEALTPTRVGPPESVIAPDGAFWLVGNAIGVFGDRLEVAADAAERFPDVLPTARSVASVAGRMFEAGVFIAPELAAPLYIRDKVALTVTERQALAVEKMVGTPASVRPGA